MGDSTSTAQLGADILDTEAFDDSWERLLEAAFPDRDQLRVVFDLVKHGIPASKVSVPDDEAFSVALYEGLARSQRLIFAALALAPTEERSRLWGLWSREPVGSLMGTIRLVRYQRATHPLSLRLSDIERLSDVFGWTQQDIVHAVLRRTGFPDVADFVVRNIDAVRTAIEQNRPGLWAVLSHSPEVITLFTDELIEDLVSTDQHARRSVQRLTPKMDPAHFVPKVMEKIETGGTLERWRAAEWLLSAWPIEAVTPDDLAWLDGVIESETSAKAASALENVRARLSEPDRPVPALPEVVFEPPTLSTSEWAELGPAMERITLAPEHVRSFLEGNRPTPGPDVWGSSVAHSAVFALGQVSFDVSLRVCNSTWIRLLMAGAPTAGWFGNAPQPPQSPLHVSAVAKHDGHPFAVTVGVIAALRVQHPQAWSAAAVSDWVAHHAIDIASVLMEKRQVGSLRRLLLRIVLDVPLRPERIERVLVQEVLTGKSSDRGLLIDQLGAAYRDVFLAGLSSKLQAERIGAADWVRHHPESGAMESLLEAARAENDDRVLAAFLTHLEALEVDIDEFVSRQALHEKAAKAMKKKSSHSKAIGWLDVESLPTLHWNDGGAVDPEVVSWMLHAAAKNKTAQPSPIVRRHIADMKPIEVEAFGRELLARWEFEDLKPIDESTARAKAARRAPNLVQGAARHPQSYKAYAGMTEQQVVEALVAESLAIPGGSARTSQGVFAVIAACGGNDVIIRARSYVRKHRGKRASQSKALIEMLAWINDPASVQIVMTMANRFRPKALQQAAAVHIAEVAEHNGWSMDDLADRSVPDGGFDGDGRRVFDFGGRSFTASLADDLTIQLADDTGKAIKSLPRGRADEDADRIKELKAEFKELKSDVVDAREFQPVRLRRAMTAGRTWPVIDFRRFFLQHPVMVKLASRVVWSYAPNERSEVSIFRPMSDGTLLTMDDEELEIDTGVVFLVHDRGQLDAVQITEHLSDYEVAPLFPQVGRPQVAVSDGQIGIPDFAGRTLSATTLVNSARNLGWQVADTEGYGASIGVVISFPDLDQEAVLRVKNGLYLGGYDYQDYDCTLSELSINPIDHRTKRLPLESISPVLLSEIMADVISMVGSPIGKV